MELTNFTTNLLRRFSRTITGLPIIMAFLLWSMPQAQASHFVGGDVFYTCINPMQYQVTMVLYRDCSGIPMDPSLIVTPICSSTGQSAGSFTLSPGARFGVEITPVCPSSLPNTTCNNFNGDIQGIEVYEYTGVITFPSACDMWQVGWTSGARNTNITNIPAGNFFIGTQINNTNNICNNSARFTSLPTPYICEGQPFVFNHGATDVDGDTLIYSLGPPLISNFNTPNTTWFNGTSASQPFVTSGGGDTLVFSSNTGQMNVTPNGSQYVVLDVYVYEIRNGDTISIIMRDMQVVVLTGCTNTAVSNGAPTITGQNGSYLNGNFVICQCDTLDFVVSLSDPDGDTLALDPIQSNIGQVFGPGNVTIFPFYPIPNRRDTMDLYVQIRTCTTDVATGSLSPVNAPGIYGFTVVATDNACPIPLPAYLGFNVVIPGVVVTASDTAICAGIAQDLQLGAQTYTAGGGTVAGTFQWVQISGPPVTFNNTLISNPIISVPGNTVPGTNIVLEVQFITAPDPVTGTSCVTNDRISISLVNLPLNLTILTPDTSLCQNGLPNTVPMNTLVSGPGVDLVNGVYNWTAIPASNQSTISNAAINNPIVSVAGAPNDRVQYAVSYTYGVCTGTDTISMTFNPGLPVVTPASAVICPGDTVSFSASLSDTFFYPINSNIYNGMPIPHAPLSCSGGIASGVTGDDQLSGALPIGFNFSFFGNSYSQFYISSNGFITFSAASGNGCCSGQSLPNTANPNNLIALVWEDLNPGSCGSITYNTIGIAPNRQLVVCYNAVCFFGSTNTVTGQIVLYEGSNRIDIHTISSTAPNSTDLITQGIEGPNGSFAYAVPGRNATGWSASGTSYSFSPDIPFDPITYQWYPNFSISNDTLNTVSVWPAGTNVYYVDVTEGNCTMTDSVLVTVSTNIPIPTMSCGTPTNYPTEILFNWGGSPGATGWEYSLDSGATWVFAPLADSSLLLTGFTNGDCFQIQVRPVGASGACLTNAAAIYTCCTTPCINPTQIASTASTNLSCFQSQDGTITFLGTQGDQGPAYTFNLYNAATGAFEQGPLTTQGSVTFSGLIAGSYYVIGTDAFGCIATSDTVTLTEPNILEASLDNTTLTLCWNTTDGTATVTQIGGTAPYSYLWDANASGQTTITATGLTIGQYQVTVIDANGCQDVVSNINVLSPFLQAPVVALATTNSTGCPGTGAINVLSVQSLQGDPTPGNPNSLSYVWYDINGNVIANDVLSVSNLTAGIYSISVTDTSGCTFVDSVQVSGAQVSINTTLLRNADCNQPNGAISINATGDSNGYTYLWSNGATTPDLTGLAGGDYSVTVFGVSGCQDSMSYHLTGGGLAAFVVAYEDRVCLGGTDGFIDIEVDTVGYGGGTLGFIWSNGAVTQNISGLSAGTYSVTVTYNGDTTCVVNPAAIIREPIVPYELDINRIDCENVEAMVSGGWPDSMGVYHYVYDWSNGGTTAIQNNLTNGMYHVTVTDDEGCEITDSVNIFVPALDPYVLQVGVTDTSMLQGLLIPLNAGPGTPEAGVTYSWTSNPTLVFEGNITNSHDAKIIADNVPGCYSITVTATADGGGCSSEDTLRVCITPVFFRGLPNAFTPDGSGPASNETFKAIAEGAEFDNFQVFNRWGQVVFDAKGDATVAAQGWDGTLNGKEQPSDMYIYILSYRMPGETEWTVLRGEVTLLR